MATATATTATSAPSSTGALRVLLRVDYPAKDQVVSLDAKTATVGDVRAALAKLDGVDAKAAPRYALLSVSYRGAIVDLSGDKVTDASGLAALGVVDGATVVARAPADIAPRKKRVGKAKGDDKDDDAKKKDEKTVSVDRYKGLTAANIWKKLDDTKAPAAKQKLHFEYFDIYAAKLLKKHALFAALPKPVVVAIAKSDTLNCKEIDLFDAVVEWGKAQVKRDGGPKPDDEQAFGAALKKALEDVLVHVRFGCMSTQDVAIKISASGFLDGDQILDLFTFLGMKSGNKNAVPGKSLAKFVSRDRKGRRPPAWFRWDANKKHNALQLSSDNTVVTSNATGQFQPVFGDAELKEGVWEWEVVLTQYAHQGHACNIGVVPTTFTNYTVGHMIGYSGHVPGWAFACGTSQKQNGADMQAYGRAPNQGETVGVRLDLDKRTIEFFLGGQSQGIAFRNVNGPVRPALSLYGQQSVTLKFPTAELKSQEK